MGYALRRRLTARGTAAILELIPSLPAEALPAATLAARDIDDAEVRARALLAIRARTGSPERDDEILAAARAAGPARVELVFAWAAAVPATRSRQLVEACRAADRWTRPHLLADAIGIAAPASLGGLLSMAATLGQGELLQVLEAVDGRAHDLPDDVRDEAIRLAHAPRNARQREERLASILHLLDTSEREELVARWKRLAEAGSGDPRVLAALPWWPADFRRGLVAASLLDEDAEDEIADLLDALPEEDRLALFGPAMTARRPAVPTGNLGALAASLPADARFAAAAEIERRATGARRVELLGSLVGEDAGTLAACLEGVDDPARAATWATVVLGLPTDPPREIAASGVRVARRVADGRLRLRLLARLAPLVPEPTRTAVMRDVLAALPEGARALDWQDWSALALAAEPGEAAEAIGVARSTLAGAARDDVVTTLAPALDDEGVVALVADLASTHPATAIQVLDATTASLSDDARSRALHAVDAVRRPGLRAVARAHLLAAGTGTDRMAERTLELAMGGDDGDLSEVLRLLRDRLPAGRAFEAALGMAEPGYRAMTLEAMRDGLPRSLRRRADAALAPLIAEGYGGGGMGAGGDDTVPSVPGSEAEAAFSALFPPAEAVAPGRATTNGGSSRVPTGAQPRAGIEGVTPGSGTSAPGGGAAALEPAAPPHVAYGRLGAPTEVVVDEPFTLDVGLSATAAPGVASAAMRLPGLTDRGYTLDVRIAAPGFVPARGESRRRTLVVTRAQPYPTTTVTLIPKPITDGRTTRRITAEYSVAGERLGDAVRVVTVLGSDALRTRPADERIETGVDVPAPTGMEVPDLTITIRLSVPPGRAEWTFDSPHRSAITPPADPIAGPLGDAAAFLRDGIAQVDAAEGQAGVFGDVLALGNRIGQLIPGAVWAAIRAAATAAKGPPTILLQCEEPYVPWELAKVQPPLVDGTDLPPFLAAQARIGRWVVTLSSEGGTPRPPANPPRTKTIGSVGIVWGSYRGTRWGDLVHAAREGRELKKRFGGTQVKPDNAAMFNLLKNKPAVDLLHFAVHGRYDPGDAGNEDGILLVDGNVLHANEVAARDLSSHPVVFLNACQLAAAKLELGSYSGIAAAFVEAGASAVVAPLWKVDDEIAMEMALAFYDAIVRGEPLSEVLRRAREPFVDEVETVSATWMAYQLFAHPSFTVDGLATG